MTMIEGGNGVSVLCIAFVVELIEREMDGWHPEVGRLEAMEPTTWNRWEIHIVNRILSCTLYGQDSECHFRDSHQ